MATEMEYTDDIRISDQKKKKKNFSQETMNLNARSYREGNRIPGHSCRKMTN